jgi:hypothetical protein
VIVNIGCIECGVSSAIVGVTADRAEAEAIVERLSQTHSWREGGQNEFEVFKLPPPGVIAEEYLEKELGTKS